MKTSDISPDFIFIISKGVLHLHLKTIKVFAIIEYKQEKDRERWRNRKKQDEIETDSCLVMFRVLNNCNNFYFSESFNIDNANSVIKFIVYKLINPFYQILS